MGPLRLLSVLSWSALVLSVGATWKLSKLSNMVHWIGRNSLSIFSIHVIIFHVNKFYIFNSAYYWSYYPQVFSYLALVVLPFPLAYIGNVLREKFRA
jgi:fucose 4-O-acetylase-like acetyltransferase